MLDVIENLITIRYFNINCDTVMKYYSQIYIDNNTEFAIFVSVKALTEV